MKRLQTMVSNIRRIVFCACALMLTLGSFLRADQVIENVPVMDIMDTTVTMTLPVNSWDGFGFFPVMVRVENKSGDAYGWQFSFSQSSRYSRDEGPAALSTFAVTAPARATRTTMIWVPGNRAAMNGDGVSLNVTVRGSGVEGGVWTTQVLNGWRGNGMSFAVSPALEADYRARREAMEKSREVPSTSVIKPSDWPADWRVWSPFAAVVMNADEFSALDTPRQTALRDWVALGGRLHLKPQKARRAHQGAPVQTARHGLGVIVMSDLPSSLYTASADDSGGSEVAEATISIADVAAEVEPVAAPMPRESREVRLLRTRPWQSVAANLLDSDEIKEFRLSQATWWLIAFLLVFGVVIGPVNLFLWAPAGRRHRLFFTVPVISLGASLLLTCVIVFHDGFGGEGTRHGLVVLLPGENKAVVVQQQISRTGMLLGKKFPVADDVVLAKIETERSETIAGKTTIRQLGAASGDWFTSRAMEGHVLMQLAPTRGRVEILAGGERNETPAVQSSMAGVLRDFVYMDAYQRTWTVDEVPPGKRVTLSPYKAKGPLPTTLYSFAWREAGRFYATMSGTELAPIATLDAIRWTDDKVLVTGLVEGGKSHE